VIFIVCKNGKSVPLQAWSGPQGSRKLRFLEFMTTAQDGGKVVSLTPRPLFTPGKYPEPIIQEAGLAPAPVWTGAENLAPTRI